MPLPPPPPAAIQLIAGADLWTDQGPRKGRAILIHRGRILAVGDAEALARAHGTWDRPLPGTAAPSLLAVTRGGWSARNPWPYRQRIADALLALHIQDQALWTGLSKLLQATLDEKRSPGALSTEELAHLQACNRALAQKARG